MSRAAPRLVSHLTLDSASTLDRTRTHRATIVEQCPPDSTTAGGMDPLHPLLLRSLFGGARCLGRVTYQIVTDEVSIELLTACMGLLGYAGAANLGQLRSPPRRRSTGGGRHGRHGRHRRSRRRPRPRRTPRLSDDLRRYAASTRSARSTPASLRRRRRVPIVRPSTTLSPWISRYHSVRLRNCR